MKEYSKYLIRATDQFNPENFSSITEEVQSIKDEIIDFPTLFKSDILVSFLKDHTIDNDWREANPELSALVISGLPFKGSIEALFESSRGNPAFRTDLETYLKLRFAE